MKKTLSLLLAFIMIFSVLPISVLAADEPSVNFTYIAEAADLQEIGTIQSDDGTELKVRLLTIDSSSYNYVSTQNSKTGLIFTTEHKLDDLTSDRISLHYKGSDEYSAGLELYNTLKDKLSQETLEKLDSEATQTCFYNAKQGRKRIDGKRQWVVTEVYGILIIQWTNGELIIPDKTDLQAAIDAAPKAEDGTYYTSGDRYNGKTATGSKGSFWADYQKALQTATSVNNDASVNQAAIDEALAALQASIDNLIPITQVNATALYESLNNKLVYDTIPAAKDRVKEAYSAATWNVFEPARTEVETLLSKLFDENGNATEYNEVGKQAEIDAAAEKLIEANKNLFDLRSLDYYQERADRAAFYLPAMIEIAETAKESDYTAESWSAFSAALTAAKNAEPLKLTEENADVTVEKAYENVFNELYQQYYYGLTPVGEITISLTYTDPGLARGERPASSVGAGALQQVTLNGDYTLEAALKSLGNDVPSGLIANGAKVYINGTYLSKVYLNPASIEAFSGIKNYLPLQLHPGDEVIVVFAAAPETKYLPTYYPSDAELWQYIDSLKTARFTQGTTLEVKAGEPFTLTAEQTNAAMGQSRVTEPGANMTLFISDLAENPTGNHVAKTQISISGNNIVTDEKGNATVTLFKEGWYLVAAYDLLPDEMGNIDGSADGSCPSEAGVYHLVNSGALIWVHVNTPEDLTALKSSMQAELDEVYKAYPESYFRPETWTSLSEAYTTGTAGIAEAATSGDAYDAQQTAVLAIKKIQNDTTKENETNLRNFRMWLNKLPDDVNLITDSAKSTVDQLIFSYEKLSDYQKKQLTGVEQKKYDAIKAYVDSFESYPESKAYTLTLNMVADTDEATATINEMAKWLRENPSKADIVGGLGQGRALVPGFTFHSYAFSNPPVVTEAVPLTQIRLPIDVNYMAYYHVRDAETHSISGNGWEIKDENLSFVKGSFLNYIVEGDLTVLINGERYEIKNITYQGIDKSDVTSGTYTTMDYSSYHGKNSDWVNMSFVDAYKAFDMPYNDVTVTITWGKAGSSLADAKASALARLEEFKNTLGDTVLTAYEEGVKAINAAATAADVEKAYQAAVIAMRKAAGSYGKVQVIVENTTYPAADGAPWEGVLVDEEIALTSDSTMMSCVVEALTKNNYTQTGAENNYLSSINGLKEFDGGGSSGWMGTLNDWFVNEGLGAFTVADGKLEDGDVIRIMYTRAGLGEDLGGSWGNSNTTLKSLEVKGGELLGDFAPGESGKTYEYTLLIKGDSASIKLTPTAANKNFLTKIFLNEQVTTNEEGASFYKRTQNVPVNAGDTVYVGCGMRSWPSMNNQSGNTQANDGTWYVLHVVSGDTGADHVKGLIDELPSSIRYEKYKAQAPAVEAARAAYEALSKSEKEKVTNLEKLKKLEAEIKSFKEIDSFKEKLAALPEADKVTRDDKAAIKDAKKDYEALTDEQKDYLTGAETEKMLALIEALDNIAKIEAKNVEELINSIGVVSDTAESREKVKAAREAYDDLNKEAKDYVSDDVLAKLEAAETKLNDYDAAKRFNDAASALPKADDVKLSDKSAIAAVRDIYNALTPEAKGYVNQEMLTKLILDEQRITDLEAAKAVDDVIEALPSADKLKLSDKEAVEEARSKYNALTPVQRALLKKENSDKLTALETAISDMEAAKAVDDAIDAIDENAADKAERVAGARGAYNKLTDAQRKHVKKLARLEELEQQLSDEEKAQGVEKLIEALPKAEDVKLADEKAITDAKAALDALTEAQKKYVSDEAKDKLTNDMNALNGLKEEIKDIENALENLPKDMTEDAMSDLSKASDDYDSLTDEQKEALSNEAKKRLEDAKQQAAVINHTDGNVTAEGLEWNVKLIATPVTEGERYDAMKGAAKGKSIISMYDISFVRLYRDGDTASYEPEEKVSIIINEKSLANYKDVAVLHEYAGDEKTVYGEIESKNADNKVAFTYAGEGGYGIAGNFVAPKTGDDASLVLYMAALIAAAAVCIATVVYKKKKA